MIQRKWRGNNLRLSSLKEMRASVVMTEGCLKTEFPNQIISTGGESV